MDAATLVDGPLPVLARATLLLGSAALLAWVLRRGAAGTRHLLWTTTFATLLCLPLAAELLPAWELPLLPAPAGETRADGPSVQSPAADEINRLAASLGDDRGAEVGDGQSATAGAVARPATDAGASARPRFGARTLLAAIWFVGTLAALLSLLVGVGRARLLVRRASPYDDPRWQRQLLRLSERLRVGSKVRLLVSADAATPMTCGWRRPVIVLPESAPSWSASRRQVVLAHELIHIRRRDAPRQLLCHLTLALYWFHPLSWLAARLATVAREQACDEGVVALGARPSEYATHLLDLAEGMGPAPAVVALPMIQRSQLERRVMAILAPDRPRTRPTVAVVAILLVGAVGVSAAVARPVPAEPANEASLEAGESSPSANTPTPEVVLPAAVSAPVQSRSCRVEGLSGNFSGTFSHFEDDGDGERYELSGWHDGDRMIQRHLDGLRLCMRMHGEVVMADDGLSVRAIGSDGWVVMESEDDRLLRMVIREGDAGIEHSWSIDGRERALGQEAEQWRDGMLAVLGGLWEASHLRGQQSSLRGKISSYRGHVSSLRGRISSYRGHVSSLRGQMSSYRGHVSSLKGQISSLRGHVSSLRGQISSHRGRISSLRSAARATSDAETQARLEREIEQQEAEIRAVEQQIVDFDLDQRVAEVEAQIAEYDLDERLGQVEGQLADYDVDAKIREVEAELQAFDLDAKVREVERQIEELDADRRAEEIERGLEPEIAALRALIERS